MSNMRRKLMSVTVTAMMCLLVLITTMQCNPTNPTGENLLMAPANLSGTASAAGQIQLTWTDTNTNELGFYLERIQQGQDWANAVVITLAADCSSFTDLDLELNTYYSYRVRTFIDGGQSDYSNIVTVKTSGPPLNAPTNLVAAAIHSDQINLSWVANNSFENGESGFIIERADAEISDPVFPAWTLLTQVGADVTSYADLFLQSLSNERTYSYRVKSFTRGSQSAYSNIDKATRMPPPVNLTIVPVSPWQINLTWVHNSNSDTYFLIEQATGYITDSDSSAWTLIARVSMNTHSFAITGLTQTTTYSFRIKAFKMPDDSSSYSNTVSATTLTATPPSAPTNLQAITLSYDEIYLKWTDTSSDEKGFKIERAPGGTSTFVQIGVVGYYFSSLTDGLLEQDTEYVYRVRAYSDAGDSPYSNTATARTRAKPTAWSLVATSQDGRTTVGQLEPIWVRWTAPEGETTSADWVAMYAKGSYGYDWITSWDANGEIEGTLLFSPSGGYWQPGEYFFVYYGGLGPQNIRVTSAIITINP